MTRIAWTICCSMQLCSQLLTSGKRDMFCLMVNSFGMEIGLFETNKLHEQNNLVLTRLISWPRADACWLSEEAVSLWPWISWTGKVAILDELELNASWMWLIGMQYKLYTTAPQKNYNHLRLFGEGKNSSRNQNKLQDSTTKQVQFIQDSFTNVVNAPWM